MESPDELLRRARSVIPLLRYEPANRGSLVKSLLMYCGAAIDAHAGRNDSIKWEVEYTWAALDCEMLRLVPDVPQSLAGRFVDAIKRLRSMVDSATNATVDVRAIETAAAQLIDAVDGAVSSQRSSSERQQ